MIEAGHFAPLTSPRAVKLEMIMENEEGFLMRAMVPLYKKLQQTKGIKSKYGTMSLLLINHQDLIFQ